jgi:hypothetical protein
VADQKPPRLEGDERETLRALLQYQRDSMIRKVTGVDERGARQPLVPSGTTLLWLMKHMAVRTASTMTAFRMLVIASRPVLRPGLGRAR